MATEKRLIDANALMQSLESATYWGQSNNVACLEAIDDAPTVDAVEVVRYNELKEENETLRRRLQHLLQSETVRMYDEIDPRTRKYRRDIRQLDAVAGSIEGGNNMSNAAIREKAQREEKKKPGVIKTAKNVEFDVIYDDGTRRHVTEGVLFEVENEQIVFHNGTDRPEVIFAAAEAAAEVIAIMNLPLDLLETVIDKILQKFEGPEG